MHGTHDIHLATGADDGGGLDPREAARLLDQSTREAQRQFNLNPLWLSVVSGIALLVAYGSLWASTRDQHPYTGRSLGVVTLVYVAVAVVFAASVKAYRSATAGVNGPSVRQQRVEGIAILVSFVLGSPVLQGHSSTMAPATRSSAG